MRSFLLHLPPASSGRPALLLAERFSWFGLLFGPFWLLRHRLWWQAVVAIVLMVALPWPAIPALHLLVGLLGADLRASALRRRGWKLEAVVVARDEAMALRRLLAVRPGLAGTFAP
ncbi:hypothetical protein EOD42_01705 [Rhodovarius crocodyli]|uniref:DUF2628 domain-containing protein n=1 Tax=Rhodovarius crocodyli TaxID=1979269 RepID=A0A437MMH9_9PROT|nr:DUF2628 domain-containing protein [Rhodovarius crocodyli]RVT98854.1 hypothetical protein EOD42_01705 [Rhodovarius crocodyli]